MYSTIGRLSNKISRRNEKQWIVILDKLYRFGSQSGADHSRAIEEVEKQHINEALNTTIGWRMSVTALLVNKA
jgi:hypothetical protein